MATLGHADSPQRTIIAITDTNGCARIEFPCYSGEFSSQVSGERIYSEHKKDVLFKYARDSVYFAHLLEHEKDLSFTVRKKVNPIPMFCNRTGMADLGLTSRKTIGFILMDAERYRIFKLTIATH